MAAFVVAVPANAQVEVEIPTPPGEVPQILADPGPVFPGRGKALKHKAKKRQPPMYCGTPACNRRLGRMLAGKRGWGPVQFRCLDELWGARESGWRSNADNPNSDAYGIPQALPGSKMGPGWRSSAQVQIKWGLGYIARHPSYRTPCGALAHSHTAGWY